MHKPLEFEGNSWSAQASIPVSEYDESCGTVCRLTAGLGQRKSATSRRSAR